MAKKILPLFIFFSFFYSASFSQDFLGLGTGNYSGISGVSLQPASIVDSRYKFDLNVFSTGINYSNNYFLLDRNVLLKFNKNKFNDYAAFKNEYLSQASLKPGEKVFFNIDNRTQLPLSFMATTGRNSAIALNMQFRTRVQGRGISQEVAELAYNDFYHPPLTNTTIDASGTNINSLSWAEIGFTYGRVLISSDKHFLKGAVTGKYLAGLSSIDISSNDLKLRVNSDSTFDFTSSNVSYNHNKNADFDQLFNRNFNPDANSFGLDAGLVYEYRGNIERFKYLKTNDERSYDALRRDVNKYIFKFGVSLLDVGMFNFNKPANVNSFQGNISNWNIRNAHYKSIKDFDTALANRVIPNPNDPGNYHVYLPTALSAQFDVKFVKGLFLNVMSYWPVTLGDEPGKRFNKYGYYSITPRFETRHFGLYLPYTVTQRNDLTDYIQHLLGATVRVGPLFIGSSNLGSMLFNNKLKSADVHVGLKVGFTYGKPDKSSRALNALFKERNAYNVYKTSPGDGDLKTGMEGYDSIKIQNRNRLLLDYKNGKIFENISDKSNIIIINNYYGISPEKVASDTFRNHHNYPVYNHDSLSADGFGDSRLQEIKVNDSVSKITTDSLQGKRQELDSLIKSMQRLQMQMDSINKAELKAAADSSVSVHHERMQERRNVSDSAIYQQDSLQAGRRVALIPESNASMQESLQTELKKREDSVVHKKKVEAAPDSVFSASKQGLTDSLENDADHPAANNSILIPVRRNAIASAGFAERNTPDSREYQRLQKQQNELYQQYARQAAVLSKDVDRLNNRLLQNRRNDRRNNISYIPVPVPVNSSSDSKKQRPAETIVSTRTDTVYIRDSVILRDTIHLSDSLNNFPSDVFVKRPLQAEPLTDTVFVREVVPQPAFDYASLPEENILFGLGKASVQPIYDNRLNFMADLLLRNPGLKVRITGHTDSSGSRAINEKLSLQRAEAVAVYLLKKGVSQNQLIVASEAFENPAVTGNTKSARSQNRRVALKLITGQ